MNEKNNMPEVKRYSCKEPEEIIRVAGIEYIYKFSADKQMQALRDELQKAKVVIAEWRQLAHQLEEERTDQLFHTGTG